MEGEVGRMGVGGKEGGLMVSTTLVYGAEEE